MMTKKSIYRIKNWKNYNNALVQRGSLTVWLSEDARQGWLYQGPHTQGHPTIFSDAAIECALMLRTVFRLPLRQTEGFMRSVLGLLEADLPIPDYTTLCLRARDLSVRLIRQSAGSVHLLLDSTGLKIRGEGEWKRKIHGHGNHRRWRKLSIAVNRETQEIEAAVLTPSRVHDGTHVPGLLKQVKSKISSVITDGSYDRVDVYHVCWKRGALPVIPPRKDAKIRRYRKDPADGKWRQRLDCMKPRDAAIREIRKSGRKKWKILSGYHQRSLVETAMFRLTKIFGSDLRNRSLANQKTEAFLRCKALNLMTQFGMPKSVKIA